MAGNYQTQRIPKILVAKSHFTYERDSSPPHTYLDRALDQQTVDELIQQGRAGLAEPAAGGGGRRGRVCAGCRAP